MKHDLELVNAVREMARTVMIADSASGVSIGAWRAAVVLMCRHYRVPEPDDVIAWVSDGKSSDADVTDWSQSFGMS
ncbi:hypothetical protein GCM10011360_04350 [Primorskyibacter flagellatus]|uniref:Uncharacterized protein n=1 Tax=Primorskyibacter flagellatus TaxID=1387277 RepID=A0A917EC69_9RHOB|nr:hypothetical protein [Primorskyibacter flagellatus]GGE18734.1 hypothetical protein GCM10011360_04350 [Primorskyibacter flagellatus]